MIVMLFLILSVTAGVFMTARQTNAPAVDEIIENDISGENNNNDMSSENDTEHDGEKEEYTSPDDENITAEDNETEITPNPTAEATATPTAAPTATPVVTPQPTPKQPTAVLSDQMRAMWISYLEFQSVDFSSKNAFVSEMTKMFADCADMGLNTVIVQVRPFGDALYNSSIYPTSHLISGTQGTALKFDPLEEMVKML